MVHSPFDVLGEAPYAELSTPACYLCPWWAVPVGQEAGTGPGRVNATTHPLMLAPCAHYHSPRAPDPPSLRAQSSVPTGSVTRETDAWQYQGDCLHSEGHGGFLDYWFSAQIASTQAGKTSRVQRGCYLC